MDIEIFEIYMNLYIYNLDNLIFFQFLNNFLF